MYMCAYVWLSVCDIYIYIYVYIYAKLINNIFPNDETGIFWKKKVHLLAVLHKIETYNHDLSLL